MRAVSRRPHVGDARHLRHRPTTVGVLVNDGFDATVDRGRIALQAEGAEVEFRKVEIGPLSK